MKCTSKLKGNVTFHGHQNDMLKTEREMYNTERWGEIVKQEQELILKKCKSPDMFESSK